MGWIFVFQCGFLLYIWADVFQIPSLTQSPKTLPAMLDKNVTTNMTRFLAESINYKVTSEYESVTLYFKSKTFKKSVYIGHFYGDPDCAIISRDEKYLVVAGCGLLIYRLVEPFNEVGIAKSSPQYSELFNDVNNIWWVNGLYQTDIDRDWKFFRFVAANKEGEFIYKMNTEDISIEKIGLPIDNIQTNTNDDH